MVALKSPLQGQQLTYVLLTGLELHFWRLVIFRFLGLISQANPIWPHGHPSDLHAKVSESPTEGVSDQGIDSIE